VSKSRENFVRLAESRTNSILKSLDLLGNLSNRSNYTYDDADVQKIFGAINKRLKEVRHRFDVSSKKNKQGDFKL
jgi:D-arabinose 5-phosphate isomerase GutQ